MTRATAKAYWMARIKANIRLRIGTEFDLLQTPYLVDHDFHLVDWSIVRESVTRGAAIPRHMIDYDAPARQTQNRRAIQAFERAARQIREAAMQNNVTILLVPSPYR